jgi:hypothetical protein
MGRTDLISIFGAVQNARRERTACRFQTETLPQIQSHSLGASKEVRLAHALIPIPRRQDAPKYEAQFLRLMNPLLDAMREKRRVKRGPREIPAWRALAARPFDCLD